MTAHEVHPAAIDVETDPGGPPSASPGRRIEPPVPEVVPRWREERSLHDPDAVRVPLDPLDEDDWPLVFAPPPEA